MFNQIKIKMRNKRIIKILILTIITILIFCFIMKNYFPAEWSFITPHKQGDFVRVGNMTMNRYDHEMLLLDDGRVFILGWKKAEIYNPKTRTFTVLDNNGVKINNYAKIVKLQDGRVLMLGGSDKNKGTSSNTVIFNPKTNHFILGPNMITGREAFAVVLLNDGRVFIAGGEHHDKEKWKNGVKYEINLKSTEFYNPKTNKFEQGPDLLLPRSFSHAILLENGNVLMFGGHGEYDKEQGPTHPLDIDVFNPYTNKISRIGKLSQAKFGDFAIRTKNNNIYMFEGLIDGKFVKTVELYNPETNVSKIVANRASSADQISPILLPDDTILFAGGTSGFSIGYAECKSAQIFDPKTNSFKWLKKQPSIPIPNGAKVLLKDGNVLMTGGGHNGNKYAVIYMFNKKIEK